MVLGGVATAEEAETAERAEEAVLGDVVSDDTVTWCCCCSWCSCCVGVDDSSTEIDSAALGNII